MITFELANITFVSDVLVATELGNLSHLQLNHQFTVVDWKVCVIANCQVADVLANNSPPCMELDLDGHR